MNQYNNALAIGAKLQGKSYQYQIVKVLGQGSFGITYMASVKMTGALGTIDTSVKVAIKEFFMGDINGRQGSSVEGLTEDSLPYKYKQRFKKEAENLSKLNHPNIVKVSDFIEANNTFYYVMEYIDGEDLLHYMDDKPLPSAEAVSIIKTVGEALAYMHEEAHMLHLDLKPGNIMRRSSDGHIFLIDFGLTKEYTDDGKPETSTTIGQGTTGYAPIEQTNPSSKKNSFRPTIDVYALGATLLKLLTAETIPSASDVLNDDELLDSIMSRHGIDGQLKDVILKAMDPRPKQRIPSARAFVKSLGFGTESKTESYEKTVYDDSLYAQYDSNSVSQFYENLAKVREIGPSGKYGFIDRTGRLVIPCKWRQACFFSDGLAEVMDENRRWGYIDKIGHVVIPCVWKSTTPFINGYATVGNEKGESLKIDKDGHVVHSKSYINVVCDNQAIASVKIDGNWRGVTPNKFEVSEGKHTVEVEKGDGLFYYKTEVYIKGKVVVDVIASLKRKQETPPKKQVEKKEKGIIHVQSIPSGANVRVDSYYKGTTPLTLTLDEGEYRVNVQDEHYHFTNWEYGGVSYQVNLKSGETSTINTVFDELKKKYGVTNTNSFERGTANHSSDGKMLKWTLISLAVVFLIFILIVLGNSGKSDNYYVEDIDSANYEMVDTFSTAEDFEVIEGDSLFREAVRNSSLRGIKGYQTTVGVCDYVGETNTDGIPEGIGCAIFIDGRNYEGEFKNGMMSGKGKFTMPSGDVFEGQMVNDYFYKGRYTTVDGDYFEGTFENGDTKKGIWYNKRGRKI